MNFAFKFLTQTQIGKLFGVSSHKIGEWLKSLGLRDEDGKPTQKAHDGNFCETAPSGISGYHWVWNSEKTVTALRESGHLLVANPPQNLVAPAILNGPFSVRKSASAEFVVENGDGSASVWANNRMTADVLTKILNMAHTHGVIDRLCRPQKLLKSPLVRLEDINSVVQPFRNTNEEPLSLITAPHSAFQIMTAAAPDTTVSFDGNSTSP